jgi:hypothetical protein
VLQISQNVIAALSAKSVTEARHRIAKYLRETAPAHTAGLSDGELVHRVERYEGEAQALGLVSECDIARWAFLETMSGGRLFEQPSVRMQFDPTCSGRIPSDVLDLLFDEIAERLRRNP